jgi:cytoskeletal protein CcmA (bactofilin family)
MKETNNKDLKINGITNLPGGTFNNVKINGQLTLTSDFICNDINVNGMFTAEGKTKAIKGKINGSANFNNDVEFESLNINGKSLVKGESKIKDLKIEGQMRLAKNLTAEEINVFGIVNMNENCNSEIFKTKGSFTIDGMLNAGTIDVELHGRCTANEIGGEKIRIAKGSKNYFNKLIKSIFSSFNFFDIRLITNVIEGDQIYLEYTKASIVRGDSVEIGPGCEIDMVEFKNKFVKSENSTVKENRKI